MLHPAALREPHEAAGTVLTFVRLEDAIQHVHAVRVGMGVPSVREARLILNLQHPSLVREMWLLTPRR